MAKDERQTVSAHPVKSFFVHMLTRDISLQDAILDLLDNSVDGIQRSAPMRTLQKARPYEGYWAKIHLSETSFKIEDNCGGIPKKNLDYVFRMGRIHQDVVKGRPTVGTYGIGMKRAIFKIGTNCVVTSHASDASYKVELTKKWMADENNWDLGVREVTASRTNGTSIEVKTVDDKIKKVIGSDQFRNSLDKEIATHFAYIIAKGFDVYINDKKVTPKAIKLLYEFEPSHDEVRPYIYEAEHDGVEVLVIVGFTAPILGKEETDRSEENYSDKFSSAQAGWTVICNDRTVLYSDKSALTGWGVSGVPQYHPQFTSISGIAIFQSDEPSKLPTTTTKRGVDASSTLYLHVRDKMIEGMKLFTQYTNQWKGKELIEQSKARMREAKPVEVEDIRERIKELRLSTTKGTFKGRQYKPDLPRPVSVKTTERITFTRPVNEVKKVSRHLFDNQIREPRVVGEKCFELILEEARR